MSDPTCFLEIRVLRERKGEDAEEVVFFHTLSLVTWGSVGGGEESDMPFMLQQRI